ncbi:MAG TPA: carboxylating nicotinate-nucleotide diphosphorylase [Spirochaetia bacterium]|nr:carboxylating nicotinate-nucleotide diphosphorylase [Spirochaetia bacterium]
MGINGEIHDLLVKAFAEDLGNEGDVTSEAVFADESAQANLLCRENGVLAGTEAFEAAFRYLDSHVTVTFKAKDGDEVAAETVVATVTGKIRTLLSVERTALNLVSYLSGIATQTRRCVRAASSGHAVILDTRKTLPGYRSLAKYAVSVGGGRNHRMGLYDMVLLKNNHVDAGGGVESAVSRVRSRWNDRFRIEVECRTLDEVASALSAHVDMIMLDNMPPETTRDAIALVRENDVPVPIECSGDMTEERIRIYSALGCDFISVGRLTHSVEALNFSFRIRNDGASESGHR